MEKKYNRYYIIREDVLPEAVQKTIKMKKALEADPDLSILEAAKKFDLSRSAFYKYKDTIFPVQDFKKDSVLTMSVTVDDIPGILGKILTIVNEEKCSVITIHQTVPINNRATIIFSVNIDLQFTTIEKLKLKIENLDYVNKVKVIGFSI